MAIDHQVLARFAGVAKHARAHATPTHTTPAPSAARTLKLTHTPGDVVTDLVTHQEVTIVSGTQTHELVQTPDTSQP